VRHGSLILRNRAPNERERGFALNPLAMGNIVVRINCTIRSPHIKVPLLFVLGSYRARNGVWMRFGLTHGRGAAAKASPCVKRAQPGLPTGHRWRFPANQRRGTRLALIEGRIAAPLTRARKPGRSTGASEVGLLCCGDFTGPS
jgi:hypothetical protein